LATKIPFEGTLKEPNTNVWYAMTHVLKNAFIRAIIPAIDNDITIASVDPIKQKKKTFFEKVFGSKDQKKDKAPNNWIWNHDFFRPGSNFKEK